jgi:2-keto-4-pentenoate hydratase/2-oxohepta-3-ene-1,7-dioic acid hydratase in catechol pathway
MQFVTLKNSGHPTAGVIVENEVLNLVASAQVIAEAAAIPASVRDILATGDTGLALLKGVLDTVQSADDSLREQLLNAGALQPLVGAKLLAPIPDPRTVLSCGMNYRGHLKEMGGGIPDTPTGFLKSVSAVVGPDANIVLPSSHPDMVDWEAEFCGVIGKPCHAVSEQDALDYVAGYTMINDVSARNWVRPMHELQGLEATSAWDLNLLGKQFPTFCPMGPSIVTKDQLDPANAKFELTLNGKVKQSACTDDLVFSLARLIAYYSQWYQFEPGDVISTGSPAGVGMGEKPFLFLKAGDVVTITADKIGSMTNTVVAQT